ncbi:MAG: hypothetical protein ACRYGK_06020 [Janthinobacterium lividum]
MPDPSNDCRPPQRATSVIRTIGQDHLLHAPSMEGEQALAAALDDEYDLPVCHSDWIQHGIGQAQTPQTWLQHVLTTALRACHDYRNVQSRLI